MPLLTRFIFREFWKYFFTIFISYVGIFFFGDLIANIDLLFKYNPAIQTFIVYSLLKLPQALYFIIPISTLTASMFLFASLNKNFELISYRTLVVPKKIIIKPLILSGIIISFISLLISNAISPKTNYYVRYYKLYKIQKKRNIAVSKGNNVWYHKKNYIIRIKLLLFTMGIMDDISIIKLDKNFKITERIDAPYGLKKGKKWILMQPTIYKFSSDYIKEYRKLNSYTLPFSLNKEDFYVIEEKIKDLSIIKLFKLIKTLKKNKFNIAKYEAELINKITYPFISIIFILLGFYLNIKPAKRGGSLSIIMAIFLGSSYFLLNGFFLSLSKIRTISPFIGPILSIGIFSILLFWLNKKIKY